MLSDKSRSAATSENELFATIVNGWSPLTITRKSLIKDVATVLDPPLMAITNIYIYILHPDLIAVHIHSQKTSVIWKTCELKFIVVSSFRSLLRNLWLYVFLWLFKAIQQVDFIIVSNNSSWSLLFEIDRYCILTIWF